MVKPSEVHLDSAMMIPFEKASACGNDFLIVDGRYAGDSPEELTRKMCDRNNGVGADGVEWVYPPEIGSTPTS